MTLTRFWKIIDLTRQDVGANRGRQIKRIEKILSQCEPDDLKSFDAHLSAQISLACTFHFMVATFVVFSELDDSLFVNFRIWVILQGSKAFAAAVKNPDTIAKLLSRRQISHTSSSGLLGMASLLWLAKTGDIKSWQKMTRMPKEPPIRTSWPTDRAEFEKRYPVLFRAFWNQKQINANQPALEMRIAEPKRTAMRSRNAKRPREQQKSAANKSVREITPGRFWKTIDAARHGVGVDRARQVDRIAGILRAYDLDALAGFKKQFDRQMLRANTFHFMVAAFLVYGYISDDLFLEFRAWVMLNGRRAFAAAVKNPDSITKLLKRADAGNWNCRGFPELPLKVWYEQSDDSDPFFKKAGSLEEPAIAMPWPESKQQFEERSPVLFQAFWNPKRIRMFHQTG